MYFELSMSYFSKRKMDTLIYSYLYENLPYYILEESFIDSKRIKNLKTSKYSFIGIVRSILNTLGLNSNYEGIFLKMDEKTAICQLMCLESENFNYIMDCINRYKENIALYDSWEIVNENVAQKNLNKNTFKSSSVGIPHNMEKFWNIDERDSYTIRFLYKDKCYSAGIERLYSEDIFLYWDYEFEEVLSNELIKSSEFNCESNDYPIMRFERISEDLYGINLISKLTCSDKSELLDEKLLIAEQKRRYRVRNFTISELREKTENNNGKEITVKLTTTKTYIRDSYVKEYTKRLANGHCQLCGKEAPFNDNYGIPYLETHHIIWLSNGGEDSIENTVALCPNCHRKMHIVNTEEDIEKLLSKKGLIK